MTNFPQTIHQCFVHPSPLWSLGARQAIPQISQRRKLTQYTVNTKTITPSCTWIERKATVNVEMEPEQAFDYYSDLEAMPNWSPWLRSVEVDKVEPDVSRWTIAAKGIQVSWKARNTNVKRGEIIAWKSESGLTNRGRVTFVSTDDQKTAVTLAIEFDLPSAIARTFDNEFIGRFIDETLLADLKRFRTVALSKNRKRVRAIRNQTKSPVNSTE